MWGDRKKFFLQLWVLWVAHEGHAFGRRQSTFSELDHLAEIETRTVVVQTIQKSPSQKFFEFQCAEGDLPEVGKWVLFDPSQSSGQGSSVFLKVLRRDPIQRRLWAQLLSPLPEPLLEAGAPPPLLQATQGKIHYKLKNREVAGVPPEQPPPKARAPSSEKQEPEEKSSETSSLPQSTRLDPIDSSSLEEEENLMPDSLRASLGPTFFSPHGAVSFSGGLLNQYERFKTAGLRARAYLKEGLFWYHSQWVDSIALEGNLFFYQASNLGVSGDSYTFLLPGGTLQYHLSFQETWGLFFYGGGFQPFLMKSQTPSSSVLAVLETFGLSLGGGGFLQMGPHWFLRVDLGLDSWTGGLELRF